METKQTETVTRASHLPALPDLRGRAAIHAAQAHGAPLYVLTQRGWFPAGPGALGRAIRKEQMRGADAQGWIYGADSSAISNVQHCAGCWHPRYASIVTTSSAFEAHR